ncbi:MAG TPA: hypothetical protein DC049_16165 [Spirochaetia bacterium]|nr:hypothetical protein [Spirochaetia bacterium]
MKYKNTELHNIYDLIYSKELDGHIISRVPGKTRKKINPRAQNRVMEPAGSEIRFICPAGKIKLTISCPREPGQLVPFFGTFMARDKYTISGKTVIEIEYPERMKTLKNQYCSSLPFHPSVWRLKLRGTEMFVLHNIEGEGIAPPADSLLPEKCLLTYGTSITHGAAATLPHLSYAAQTARRLKYDLLNFGVGGSAFCEPAFTDFMAGLKTWDLATLCLSVNMLEEFSVKEFIKRAGYMIKKMSDNPKRHVFCISILPFFRDFGIIPDKKDLSCSAGDYRLALHEITEKLSRKNVHFISGNSLLEEIDGLSTHLIHPSDYGMIQIGEKLTQQITAIMKAG